MVITIRGSRWLVLLFAPLVIGVYLLISHANPYSIVTGIALVVASIVAFVVLNRPSRSRQT